MFRRVSLLIFAALFLLTACSSSDESSSEFLEWDDVLDAAPGQTVKLWMWGGDAQLNAYIEDIAEQVSEHDITLEQVRLDATSDGINQIVSEFEAGANGSVDLIWVNGVNFAQGKTAGLWRNNWVGLLPNSDLLDTDDPTLTSDFGVPTDGEEVPWSRAAFTFAHDPEAVLDPPQSFEELAIWVAENPGRFTYPAPPDFTGSAFVRQAVQALGEDNAFDLLQEMKPNLWQGGATFPRDEAELSQLFASGQIDIAMSYNPNFVEVEVAQGSFPDSTRPYVFASGTLQNVSFLALPANASAPAAAMFVANELLSQEAQAKKFLDVGVPPVVDIEVSAATPYRLDSFGKPLQELDADRVIELDRRWRESQL